MTDEVPTAGATRGPPADEPDIGAGGPEQHTVGAEEKGDAPTARSDFRLLWTGQTVSLVGDQFMLVALPLMAVTTLGVAASQAALLPFAFKFPFLLLGLPAGAILDRMRRRPTMIVSEVAQLVSCLLVAVLAMAHALPFWLLMGLIGVNGCVVVFFQVAYTSYLPSLFGGSSTLQRANARLQLSESVSRSVGPMAAGPLIALTGPAGAILVNSGSFLASAATLLGIRHREPPPQAEQREPGWLAREIREGLGFVLRHPLLEPVLMCGAVYVLFQSMVTTILVLYCAGVLKLGVAAIGLVVGAAALGYPIGNLVCGRLVDRIGTTRTIVLGATLSVSGFVIMGIAGAAGSVPGLIAGSIVHGIGEGAFGPTWTTLRQTSTPARLLGRVNSVERFLLWGVVPLGSLVSSVFIALIGLAGTFWVGTVGTALCLLPLLRRGVLAELRTVPQQRTD
ncbi:MFS transporter [Solihabitans fulvus]|uniref:MFS transporter n=1 Tax=Solihabitans fulvus TaxID=1892852 RepID=A0A5B2WZP4_9PSEU|nr:MFS transporter [Solihabitans fulvus]KAA2255447.1 MFS transporter [Solihabitans fulvus]